MPIEMPKCPYCNHILLPSDSSVSWEDEKITKLTVDYDHDAFTHHIKIHKVYKIDGEEIESK